MTLLHTSDESETRTLTIVGVAIAFLCVVVAGSLYVFDPFAGRAESDISVSIDTPYVGQGVATGTALVMHGVTVGQVTGIFSLPEGGVRLNADLNSKSSQGLTDTMKVDYRPINYFGVTGINLSPGSGGQALFDGIRISTIPRGNFTLQTLLTRLGEVTTGVVTPQLIQVIDRATRYTDALNPLVETMLIAANAVAEVQTVSTEQLLTNATGISVAFPGFVNSAVKGGDNFIWPANYLKSRDTAIKDITEEHYRRNYEFLKEANVGLFRSLGQLLRTHSADLFPVTEIVRALFGVVPPLIRPADTAQMMAEMRTRFEKMYQGTPEQRALQVRIVLDSLPGVAAPIAAIGGQQ
ncbi:MCE family protein [Mycolicibacterium pyrenivorans]|uniref:MCE family protein n=1 Tax=Mycolicibacterium pyrenivorans TaxID=187102 RepID=UPI0021F3870C|nr:MCE family protein [Mycolicibacterium pyrenivorans]MCV7150139.1 Mammalian cell entry related domain protein [Mycolicibacterium pyrenivorans]